MRRRVGKTLLLCLLLAAGGTATSIATGTATGTDIGTPSDREQYLVLNIIPGENFAPIFEQIKALAPAGALHPRPGIGAIFSYLDQSRESLISELLEFLSLSERFDIPVVVQLDGEQWWEARPDLWNWWDPARPGFDTVNRENVEWYGWGPQYAMKIAWRNWGRQIRVLPPPNLMSPRYRAACREEMNVLIPLILKWWDELPADRKDLLIGIKLGWESSIGVNAFYLPNGNALLDRPEAEDTVVDLAEEKIPDRGMAATGYAAVSTAGLAYEGALKEAHICRIVSRHLENLCSLAADLGVPRERLFTHVGGWKDEELLYHAAYNRYSCPGWSFYRHAKDPRKDEGVRRVLKRSDAPYWGAVEWMLEGEHDAYGWYHALVHTLSDPKCRYVNIYNWSGIRENRSAVEAIRKILAEKRGR